MELATRLGLEIQKYLRHFWVVDFPAMLEIRRRKLVMYHAHGTNPFTSPKPGQLELLLDSDQSCLSNCL